jgi:hypothetical protein
MTQRLVVVILFIASGMAAASHIPSFANANKPPFSLTLSVPESVASVKSRVRFDIVLANTSEEDIVVMQYDISCSGYRVSLQGIDGSKVSETDLGHRMKDPSYAPVCTQGIRTVLKPGETLKDEFVLNDLYQLDSPGKYVVQAFRDVPSWMGSKGTVASNTVTITLTEETKER